ncbi:MAG TPA: 2-C-methyl-D-erythritol 4-phosphate cytidylyltransferase [Terriglobales bacterium]|nr:2-C-methyl-D-erythritol 4-phosphate cytidylyltransferase [Terriglobales bacterium]
MSTADAYAIIPAAGLSTRMGSTTSGQARKQLAEVAGAPIFIHTLRRFDRCPGLQAILVPVRPEDRAAVETRIAEESFATPVRVLDGGNARQDSVWNAVQALAEELGPTGDDARILIHDAVRPFVDDKTIAGALAAAEQHPAVIVAIPAVDTVKQVERVGADANRVTATLPRERIVLAQTPQVFRLGLLRRAFAHAQSDGFYATDEAALVEHLGEDVFVVPGSPRNWKITTPTDLALAEATLTAGA